MIRYWTLTLLLLLALGAAPGCSGDDDEEDGTSDVIEDAEQSGLGGDDIQFFPPCAGIEKQDGAEEFDDECIGVDECTVMPDKTGCFCAYCGPLGAEPHKCYQVRC